MNPGGVCLYRGCIPSKALLHVAKLIDESRHAKNWGIEFGEPKIDLARLRSFKEGVVSKLTGGLGQLSKQRKVQFIQGKAAFQKSNTLRIAKADGTETSLTFDRVIIATGSRPAVVPSLKLDSPRMVDSTGALDLKDIPGTLLVVGGGYIGLELGSVYAALGSKVTVVEMTAGLLPGADRDLVLPLYKRIEKSFAAILLNTTVTAVKQDAKGLRVSFDGLEVKQREQVFDKVLVSVGRKPNSEIPGLDKTQVKLGQRGFIQVNKQLQTNDPVIYAIGDVVGEPMLAHKASHEGRTQAQKDGREIKVAKFPWAASGRAMTIDRTEGLTKVIFDPKTERVLGVGIVGAGAGELIAEGVLAVEMAATATDLALTIHPHPTLSETVMNAAEVFFGTATDIYRPKKA
jgi:dihydrolipoamide dehydrogenase